MLPSVINLDMCWASTTVLDDMNTVEHSVIHLTYLFIVHVDRFRPDRTNRIGESDLVHEELCGGGRSGVGRRGLRGSALSPGPSMQRAFPMAESSWRTLAHCMQDHAAAISTRGELRCFGLRTCPTMLQSFTLNACEKGRQW